MDKGHAQSADLARLAALVAARMGLHFPESRRRDLVHGALLLARERGEDAESLLQSLVASPLTDRQIELLTAHLTVGETYFFREMKSLDAFRNHVVPELIRRRAGGDQRLRIWSAGCSTGEEAYSIAMILAELIPDLDAWGIHILATDINPESIEKARRGVYTEWSFRGVPASLRDRCCTSHGPKTFAVRPRFKNMVSFACLNLATDVYPSLENATNAMDVIFCRNVMMYFVPELVQRVIRHFHNCLVDGGWLIVAPCETSLLLAAEFSAVSFDGATLYRKESGKPAVAAVGEHAPPAVPEAAVEGDRPIFAARQREPSTCEARELGPSPAHSESTTHAHQHKPPTAPSVKRHADRYEEALAAYQAGRYADAEAVLRTLFDAHRSGEHGLRVAPSALALMARIDANRGELDQAAEWAQQAIAADKTNPGFYHLLATIVEEQNRPTDAVAALKRALYLDPAFVLAHFALGNIALRKDGPKHAARHFQNAASLLARMPRDEVVPESEGVTAGRLLEIIETMTAKEVSAP
ncbi:MAG: CheR family methyltransferase [Pirellulales bacterium]